MMLLLFYCLSMSRAQLLGGFNRCLLVERTQHTERDLEQEELVRLDNCKVIQGSKQLVSRAEIEAVVLFFSLQVVQNTEPRHPSSHLEAYDRPFAGSISPPGAHPLPLTQ